jgi:hypothetical protein
MRTGPRVIASKAHPPIDWSKIRTAAEIRKLLAQRRRLAGAHKKMAELTDSSVERREARSHAAALMKDVRSGEAEVERRRRVISRLLPGSK